MCIRGEEVGLFAMFPWVGMRQNIYPNSLSWVLIVSWLTNFYDPNVDMKVGGDLGDSIPYRSGKASLSRHVSSRGPDPSNRMSGSYGEQPSGATCLGALRSALVALV